MSPASRKRERPASACATAPTASSQRRPDSDRDERPTARGQPSVGVGRDRDQARSEQARSDVLPCGGGRERASVEDGYEAERDRSERDAPEPGCEQQVERASFDEEANAREHADEGSDDGDSGVEDEPGVVELVDRLQRVARREQRRPGGEQADEQDLSERATSDSVSARA